VRTVITLAGVAAVVAACASKSGGMGHAPPGPEVNIDSPAFHEVDAGLPPMNHYWKRPFLWRIERTPPSYVFATIEGDERMTPLLPSISKAFDGSQAVFTEVARDAWKGQTAKLALPHGKSLKTELPADLVKRVNAALRKQGDPPAAFAHSKLWWLSLHFETFHEHAQTATLEAHIYTEASDSGKAVGGILSPEEVIAWFDGMTRAEQVQLLRESLANVEANKVKEVGSEEPYIEPFLAGDDAAMQAVIDHAADFMTRADAAIQKHNGASFAAALSDKIVATLDAAPTRSHFFLVWAPHALGDRGVVGELGKRNVKLTRLGAE